MLKPSDQWHWYYDTDLDRLMLNLGEDMLFKTQLAKKSLVNCALRDNEFTVDDASAYQTFKEACDFLDLNPYRKTELTLYCLASMRFHKPVQPKSWFFIPQFSTFTPQQADIVCLETETDKGLFIVLEVGDSSSLCACVDIEGCQLNQAKSLAFGETIKVMHDRMLLTQLGQDAHPVAMVG